MARYAADTSVAPEQTRVEIEGTLRRYGADSFLSGWSQDNAFIGFRVHGLSVRFVLPMPKRTEKAFTHYRHNSGQFMARSSEAATKAWDQAIRQRWRALALAVKAKLEAVESGISSIE